MQKARIAGVALNQLRTGGGLRIGHFGAGLGVGGVGGINF